MRDINMIMSELAEYNRLAEEITYHVTKTGNVIFDYIKVLEG